jgi:predicted RNA-binding protein
MAGKRYWIAVTGIQNFEILRHNRFAFFAVGPRFRNIIQRVQPGDELVLYRAGGGSKSGFTLLARVTGPAYERHTREFAGMRLLPHRIGLQPINGTGRAGTYQRYCQQAVIC